MPGRDHQWKLSEQALQRFPDIVSRQFFFIGVRKSEQTGGRAQNINRGYVQRQALDPCKDIVVKDRRFAHHRLHIRELFLRRQFAFDDHISGFQKCRLFDQFVNGITAILKSRVD